MTNDPIPKKRPKPTNTIPKNVGIGFHTFTLDNVKVAAWPQRIQDFYTWMVAKNLVEREKYMILLEFTSRFSSILRDWWTAIGVAYKNFFLTSQDFAVNLNVLLEVFCGDTDQRREKLRRQLFKMKGISFDRDIIDIHFQKMEGIYFELGGDSSLRQTFVSSLPRMLAVHAIMIIEDRFKSITIPHIRLHQASYLSSPGYHRARRKSVKKYRRFKLPRPHDNRSRMTRHTKFFRRRSDHTKIYLSKNDDLESVFSLEDELMGKTLFSIDVYEMVGDDTNINGIQEVWRIYPQAFCSPLGVSILPCVHSIGRWFPPRTPMVVLVKIINNQVQARPEISLYWKFPISILSLKMNITNLNELSSRNIGVSQKKYGLKNGLDGTTRTTTPIKKKSNKL
ncbi:hypothetical protein H5410_045297 [Solanum commersonii]|uniref:Uncharacterized protein n=1 Tax=Solanum commersonii TaxID=4109 RepID=A0A9J5XB64_SOLCO|nr:hypothetical protein H5410_045297 [Solanum commersonii]